MDLYPQDSIDKNRRLLALALDCRLIYPRKKEKIEAILAERSEAGEAADVMEVLLAQKVLTEEKAAYLLDLDAHKTRCTRDALFGRLAVANHLLSHDKLDKALAYQKTKFRQTGKTLRLGSILRDWGLIKEADCTAILMTQNRIRQEDLMDALVRLGRSPGERELINKRFGAIAIKKQLATPEQVGEALRQQKTEKGLSRPPRFLGTILQEMKILCLEDIQTILREQRHMEVRRLDLLKALYPVKAELKIFKRLNRIFACTLSDNSLQAFALKKTIPDIPVPVYEFTIWLRKSGICFGIFNDAVLESFIETAEVNQPVLVAQGQEPKAGMDQTIKFYFQVCEAPDSDPAPDDREEIETQESSQKDSTPPCPVIPGDLLAQIIPGHEGIAGKNVMGNPVHPPQPGTQALSAGKGVKSTGNDFFAAQEGIPMLIDNTTLVVSPQPDRWESVQLTHDIREDTKDRYVRTDLTVKGNIQAGARVRCRHLTLHGSLSGDVATDGDLTIEGCLGNPASSDQPVPIEVTSRGSVNVSQSVSHARVLCAGRFTAMGGRAEGVSICAGTGLRLKEVVSEGGEPSVLRAGVLPDAPLLSIDHTLESKTKTLTGLTKAEEIANLKEEFQKDTDKAKQHQLEQDIYHYLIQIVEGPELFQYPDLQDKLDYLSDLPDFSSVKEFYLKIPDTPEASNLVAGFLPPANKKSTDSILRELRSRMDSSEKAPMAETQSLETAFNARLDALEQEAEANRKNIEQIQREIKTLSAARTKLGRACLKSLNTADLPVIRIKNRCEKGTVIQGILARHVVPETVYNVRFREVIRPGTFQTSIILDI